MRLIDANKIGHALSEHASYAMRNKSQDYWDGVMYALHAIQDAPIIDAEPVRHGHWIYPVANLKYARRCSECHLVQEHGNFVYCPHCGARMDGGEENGNSNCV